MFFRHQKQARKSKARSFSFEWMQLETRMVPSQMHTNVALADGGILPAQGSTTPYGMTPAQMRHAYGADAVSFGGVTGDGTGQTIAIIDAYNQPTIASDLTAFDSYFGLPDPPSFTVINQDGATSPLPADAPPGSWGVETSLDVEWAHVIAPQANILLVEANSADDSLFTAVDTARNYPGVCAVSMSWSEDEFSGDAAYDYHFTTPAGHNGVTFLAATGDYGAYSTNYYPQNPPVIVQYPAASPNVVAVGGTTLSVDGQGNYQSESGWGHGTDSYWELGSGGGISTIAAQPAYQMGVVTQSNTQRTIPDVAMDGDPNSGVPVYDAYNFGSDTPWEVGAVGGTSLATPMYAGVIAIANQGRAINGLGTPDGSTQTLPMLYTISANDIHDVTTGNNYYPAGPGYDLVTGRGTPIVNLLANDLASDTLTPTTSTLTINGPNPSTAGQSVNFTVTVSPTVPDGESVSLVDASNGNAIVGTGTLTSGSATISVSSLSVGTHDLFAFYGGDANYGPSESSQAVQVVNSAPPSITSVIINEDISALFNAAGQPFAGAQRSMVNDIVYTFSEPVNILDPSVDPSVFTIAIASGWTGSVPTLSWAPVAGSGDTEWAVTFSGNGVIGGSIANGAYSITVNDPASITAEFDSQALNLAANGIGAATQSFYRLYGDINGDTIVNAADNLKFKNALTTYNAAFDHNQDGVVNAADNAQFKNDLTVNFSGFTATI
jgi:subtilase family serine protease